MGNSIERVAEWLIILIDQSPTWGYVTRFLPFLLAYLAVFSK